MQAIKSPAASSLNTELQSFSNSMVLKLFRAKIANIERLNVTSTHINILSAKKKYTVWQTNAKPNIVKKYLVILRVYLHPSAIINANIGKASLPIILKISY